MDLRKPLFAALAVATLAGCDQAPTAVPASTDALHGVSAASTSAPVAVITVVQKRLILRPDGIGAVQYSLTGSNSYDPDGGSIGTYHWNSNCLYLPTMYGVNYTAEIEAGDTCNITLAVWDDEGEFGMTQQNFN